MGAGWLAQQNKVSSWQLKLVCFIIPDITAKMQLPYRWIPFHYIYDNRWTLRFALISNDHEATSANMIVYNKQIEVDDELERSFIRVAAVQ